VTRRARVDALGTATSFSRRRHLLAAACGLAVLPLAARAQTAKTARVGWLGWTGGAGSAPSPLPLDAFRSGLADRGWQEGKNLTIDVRAGDGSQARELAAELLRSGAEVLVAMGPTVFGARAVAGAVPIVFSINGDPVEAKLVASLSRPGGSLTGVTALSAELAGKRMELVRELAPRAARIAAIANQSHPGVQVEHDATLAAARKLGVALQWFPVNSAGDFGKAFDAIARDRAGAVVAIPDNLVNQQARSIAEFAVKQRIPAVSGWAEFAEAGNLASYGPSPRAYYRHVAAYVDKLLRGARPADLPVEQPTEFELVVNLGAAKALGIAVPQSVRSRANRTIG
jgi:putative ABC transport system substrate-binding protein